MSLFGCKRCEAAESRRDEYAQEASSLRTVAVSEGAKSKLLQEQVEFLRAQNLDLQKRLGEAVAPGTTARLVAADAMKKRIEDEDVRRVKVDERTERDEKLVDTLLRRRDETSQSVEVPLPGQEYRGSDSRIRRDGGLFVDLTWDESDRRDAVIRKRREAEELAAKERAEFAARKTDEVVDFTGPAPQGDEDEPMGLAGIARRRA